MKPDSSDPEPEGLTLLVPDIQKTAEIVYAATTSLRQANQGAFTLQHCSSFSGVPTRSARLRISLSPKLYASWTVQSSQTESSALTAF